MLNQQGIDKYQKLLMLKKAAEFQLTALRASNYTLEQIKSPFLSEKKIDILPIKPKIEKKDFGNISKGAKVGKTSRGKNNNSQGPEK